jgi:hypothetical protein
MQKLPKPNALEPPSGWPADCRERIQSATLLDHLLADPHSEYHRCSHGGRITFKWLSDRLDTLLPDGRSKQWRATGNRMCRGYLRRQFAGMWDELGIGSATTDQLDTDNVSFYEHTPTKPASPASPAKHQPAEGLTRSGFEAAASANPLQRKAGKPGGSAGEAGEAGSMEGRLKENITTNGEDADPDADAIVTELIRQSPGLSNAAIARRARRTPTEVAAIRAALKAQSPPAADDPPDGVA